jgi:3-isopropylmalate dehydrogenase
VALPIAVMPGDGIGPEIVRAATAVMDAAARRHGAALRFDHLPVGEAAVATHGSTLPPGTLERLTGYDASLLGPVSHATYPEDDPRYPNPSGTLRSRLELHANVRPVRSYPGRSLTGVPVDLVIVRESTQGFYADRNLLDSNGELRPDRDTVLSVRVVTRRACERVARHAFALARTRRGRVTAVHKANVLRRGDGLFLDACDAVAREHPDVELDDRHVDAFALELLQDPARVDVVVTTNMFGDILSNEAAGLAGGLGLAPGLNVGDGHAMAQAAHGSAPDLAAARAGNPVAEILSGALLLRWLAGRRAMPELAAAAASVELAVEEVVTRGCTLTPDLGGSATTAQVADAVLAALA